VASYEEAHVLWIGPSDRIPTCVGVPTKWLQSYRHRVVTEWKGVILAVYRPKDGTPALAKET
jgi:hypothetical protein